MTHAETEEAIVLISATLPALGNAVQMLADTCKVQTGTIRDMHEICKSLAARIDYLEGRIL